MQKIYVQGTPYCVSGGTFDPFNWWMLSSNETRVAQTRYQANPSDTCSAIYCYQVTSGSESPAVPAITGPP